MYQCTKSHSQERLHNQVIGISYNAFVNKLVNMVLTLEWYCAILPLLYRSSIFTCQLQKYSTGREG